MKDNMAIKLKLEDIVKFTATAEEVGVYIQALEKEKLVNKIGNSLKIYSIVAATGGAGFVAGLGIPYFVQKYNPPIYNPTIDTFGIVLAFVGAIILAGCGEEIANKLERFRKAKAELDQIKRNPLYQKFKWD